MGHPESNNPLDWARQFRHTLPECNVDEDVLVNWFAAAMFRARVGDYVAAVTDGKAIIEAASQIMDIVKQLDQSLNHRPGLNIVRSSADA